MPLKVVFALLKNMSETALDWDKGLAVHTDSIKVFMSAKNGSVN